MRSRLLLSLFASLIIYAGAWADAPKPLKILFLGDNGHHKPAERFRQLQPVLAKRGIDLVYTDKVEALNSELLGKYDGLLLYANIDTLKSDQESALLEFVASGKGFVPLHCASYCFRNSDKIVALIGAQFLRHGTGTFRTTIALPNHPIMNGFRGFESWDETYVHTKHNEKDRTVLEYRVDADTKEPWTWVRTHGKGLVFYTAWGHDERTWGHPGFQNLVERGIRWACGHDPGAVPVYADRPEMTKLRKDVKPFEYVEAKIPFYPPSRQWGVTGQPISKMQKPLPSDESIKHFVTPVEFEVKLFVDETKLGGGKPICMNWDERGRLFVALTYDYPNNLQKLGQGHDRIVMCEDTDGDGVCDKVTTFAEGLSIPTSILPYAGGLIVHQIPHTIFLKDTKGTGKADFQQILFTGWGTGDTHAGPSNLRYGLDNWIYGIVGYSAFHGEVAGERLDFRQGFYRFKVEKEANDANKLKVTKLEFLRSTSNNSWGVGISEEGYLFGSTANGCPSVFMPIPNRYYEKVRGLTPSVLRNIAPDNHFEPITDKVRQVDWHGGFTAAAGSAIYTARNYPREYWNRIQFVCEPTGHLVAMFEFTPNGADFKARYFGNLLASDDEWSAPIMAEVGPDGNVWVIDWYNFIVQHNPTPPGWRTGKGAAYETELRDKKYGRIYRVVPKNSKPPAPLELAKATPQQLVETLKNDNMFWRLHAQRLLVERGKDDVEQQLADLVLNRKNDESGRSTADIHALQILQGLRPIRLDGSAGHALTQACQHDSPIVRRTAIMIFPSVFRSDLWGTGLLFPQSDPLAEVVDHIQKGLSDPDPQVRLASALAASELSSYDLLGRSLVERLRDPRFLSDPWLHEGLICAAANQADGFLYSAARELRDPAPRAVAVVALAAEHFGRKGDRPPAFLAQLSVADSKVAETIIGGLAKGWPKGKAIKLDEEAEASLDKLFASLTPTGKGNLLRLTAAWGINRFAHQAAELTKGTFATLADANASDEARLDAARQLISFRADDDVALGKILEIVTPLSPPALATGIFDALSTSTAKTLGPTVIGKLAGLTPAARAAGIRLLLSRPDTTRVLLDAIDKGQIQISDLSLDQRQALLTHPQLGIRNRAKAMLSRGGGLPDPDRQKVIDQVLPNLKKTGDAAAGRVVFKNNCAKCHRHSGEGEQIGPDLTGSFVHNKEHLLVDILDPSRNVEANYRIYRVELKDGRSLTGLLSSETKTSLELIDAEAKRHALQRSDIEELHASNKSLMPEGFEKTLNPEDLVNLLEFLTQKGKYIPIPLDKAATIVSTKGMFYSEDAGAERLIFRDWSPKTFEGVPFYLVEPRGDKVSNVIMLNGPNGKFPPTMPKSVTLPCNAPAKAIHFLSGVSGWGYPYSERGSVTMIVRLRYEDGQTEEHPLKNGEQFADYIRRVDVPGSKFAFALRGQQIRYFAVTPKRTALVKEIELVKGPDQTAPVVMAVTVETP
jgi:putative membrane-bound dehydrogenase-like protein